jgi:serine/threonine protein kinase
MADLYKGFQISGKVDMWMLGCILFTLLNNKHPFQNASSLAIVNCRYTFDQDHCKNYPPKFVELCGWLLAQNPIDRPSSSQLQHLLTHWDESEPLPLPQSVIDRIEKDARLYGIPSMARRNSVKEPRKKSAPTVSHEWTTNQAPDVAGDQWQPDFSSNTSNPSNTVFGDLLDLAPVDDLPATTKPIAIVQATSDSMPDLLG